MNKQKLAKLGKQALTTSGGMMLASIAKTKVVEPLIDKYLPSMKGNALVTNGVIVALAAAGYLFKDKILPAKYHGIVEDVCMGMLAKGTTDMIGNSLGNGIKQTIGLSGLGDPRIGSGRGYTSAMTPITHRGSNMLVQPQYAMQLPAYGTPTAAATQEAEWTIV